MSIIDVQMSEREMTSKRLLLPLITQKKRGIKDYMIWKDM